MAAGEEFAGFVARAFFVDVRGGASPASMARSPQDSPKLTRQGNPFPPGGVWRAAGGLLTGSGAFTRAGQLVQGSQDAHTTNLATSLR